MQFAPFLKQTLVSAFSKDEVLAKLKSHTQLIKGDQITKDAVFNGKFTGDSFRLSLAVRYSQNALPLAVGTVEDTSRGSIIFLQLKLFPAALLYLLVFSLVAVFIGVVFILSSKSVSGGIIALLTALVNYFILTINFQRRAFETIDALRKILTPGN